MASQSSTMDVPRGGARHHKYIRPLLFTMVAVVTVVLISVALLRLEQAPPQVDRSVLWIDTVREGEFLRQVRGNGILVSKEEWWIASPLEGQVESVLVDPGDTVDADEVILVLSNVVLERDVRDARWQLTAAEAELNNQEALLDNQLLDREEAVVTIRAELEVAELDSMRVTELYEIGLSSKHERDTTSAKAKELQTRLQLAERRHEKTKLSTDAQLAVQRATVEQMRGLLELREGQLEDLNVKSDRSGVVQEVHAEIGQQIAASATLAKLSRPDELKAELHISETQTRDIVRGQLARVDTRQGVVEGHVSRIDPAVLDGAVTVEVELDGPLPKGARPDLSVEGTIELERLSDVVHVGRPVGARSHGKVQLFRLSADQSEAERIDIALGSTSVNSVQIINGLKAGDRVILSDMSRWESVDKIRLR